MKRLLFGAGLLEPTLTEKKKITLRKYRPEAHDFSAKEIVQGVFHEGLNILLSITKDTEIKPVSKLTDEEAQEDGFENSRDAYKGLKIFYKNFKKSDILALIRFEILRVEGVPVVSAEFE